MKRKRRARRRTRPTRQASDADQPDGRAGPGLPRRSRPSLGGRSAPSSRGPRGSGRPRRRCGRGRPDDAATTTGSVSMPVTSATVAEPLERSSPLRDRCCTSPTSRHRCEVVQCRDVGISDVRDVHVVADAGAIRRRVVVAEDLRRLAATSARVSASGIRLRTPGSPELRRRGTGDVEVAQRDRPQIRSTAATARAHPLADQLGLAVRAHRRDRRVLGDEVDVGHAVRRGARGEHERLDARPRPRPRAGSAARRRSRGSRTAGRATDSPTCFFAAMCTMPRDVVVAERRADQIARPGRCRAPAARHRPGRRRRSTGRRCTTSVLAAVAQRLDDVGADVAGAAGDQPGAHERILPR